MNDTCQLLWHNNDTKIIVCVASANTSNNETTNTYLNNETNITFLVPSSSDYTPSSFWSNTAIKAEQVSFFSPPPSAAPPAALLGKRCPYFSFSSGEL